LLCIFLLIVSSTFIKINRLNKKEIIVYNYSENTIVQLINGKENFVLSQKQFADDDYAEKLLNQTNEKLHLKKPIYLTLADTLVSQCIFLERGIILFGDRTILFEQPLTTVPEKYSVDFAINPVISNKNEWKKAKDALVILNKSYIQKNTSLPNRIYTISKEGAFREKW
jgi:hypothetical protein